jgi:SpoVK/Ycf46/Vps4 family AAA+-type ATPase
MVRDVFRLAKENAPAIIFIDEVDAIATARFDAQTGADREVQRILMELLNQMDGFDLSVIVLVWAGLAGVEEERGTGGGAVDEEETSQRSMRAAEGPSPDPPITRPFRARLGISRSSRSPPLLPTHIPQVIMATNRADTLDPALLRPGRLDRKIEFPLPDRRQKRLIFQVGRGAVSWSFREGSKDAAFLGILWIGEQETLGLAEVRGQGWVHMLTPSRPLPRLVLGVHCQDEPE